MINYDLNKIERPLFIILLLLIISNLSLIHKVVSQSKKIDSLNFESMLNSIEVDHVDNKFPEFEMKDLNGNIYSRDSCFSEGKPVMFVYFSPSDCGTCLLERVLWQKISNSGIVNVFTITSHNRKEVTQWVNQVDIGLPVLYDSGSKIATSLNLKTTPVKILVDNQYNVLFIDKNIYFYPKSQKLFQKMLLKYVNE